MSHVSDMHRECAAKLRRASRQQVYFNYRMLVAWLFRGVVHALVNFFVAVVFLGGL